MTLKYSTLLTSNRPVLYNIAIIITKNKFIVNIDKCLKILNANYRR